MAYRFILGILFGARRSAHGGRPGPWGPKERRGPGPAQGALPRAPGAGPGRPPSAGSRQPSAKNEAIGH